MTALTGIALVSIGLLSACMGVEKIKLAELRLGDGSVIHNVKLWKNNEATANYSYDERIKSGFGIIDMKDLPPAVQKKIGYSPEKDAAVQRRVEEQQKEDGELQKTLDAAATLQAVEIRAKTESTGRKYGQPSRSVSVEIRNGTDAAGAAHIEVIWLRNGTGQDVGILSVSREKILLQPRQTLTVEIPFASSDRQKRGMEISGWIARAVAPESGKVLAIAAMRQPLASLADSIPVGHKDLF
jgi:hypothetical protein